MISTAIDGNFSALLFRVQQRSKKEKKETEKEDEE